MTPEQLRKKRLKLNMTQEQLAAAISLKVLDGIKEPISRQYITSMETGRKKIPLFVEKYFKVLTDETK